MKTNDIANANFIDSLSVYDTTVKFILSMIDLKVMAADWKSRPCLQIFQICSV